MTPSEGFAILESAIAPGTQVTDINGEPCVTVEVTAAQIVYAAVFEGNAIAEGVFFELCDFLDISIGLTCLNFYRAKDDDFCLLQCHEWTVKGLNKKLDEAFGNGQSSMVR